MNSHEQKGLFQDDEPHIKKQKVEARIKTLDEGAKVIAVQLNDKQQKMREAIIALWQRPDTPTANELTDPAFLSLIDDAYNDLYLELEAIATKDKPKIKTLIAKLNIMASFTFGGLYDFCIQSSSKIPDPDTVDVAYRTLTQKNYKIFKNLKKLIVNKFKKNQELLTAINTLIYTVILSLFAFYRIDKDRAKAQKLLSEAFDLINQFYVGKYMKNLDFTCAVAKIYIEYANLLIDLDNDLDEAKSNLDKAYKIQIETKNEFQFILNRSYKPAMHKLAKAYEQQNQLLKAARCYKNALDYDISMPIDDELKPKYMFLVKKRIHEISNLINLFNQRMNGFAHIKKEGNQIIVTIDNKDFTYLKSDFMNLKSKCNKKDSIFTFEFSELEIHEIEVELQAIEAGYHHYFANIEAKARKEEERKNEMMSKAQMKQEKSSEKAPQPESKSNVSSVSTVAPEPQSIESPKMVQHAAPYQEKKTGKKTKKYAPPAYVTDSRIIEKFSDKYHDYRLFELEGPFVKQGKVFAYFDPQACPTPESQQAHGSIISKKQIGFGSGYITYTGISEVPYRTCQENDEIGSVYGEVKEKTKDGYVLIGFDSVKVVSNKKTAQNDSSFEQSTVMRLSAQLRSHGLFGQGLLVTDQTANSKSFIIYDSFENEIKMTLSDKIHDHVFINGFGNARGEFGIVKMLGRADGVTYVECKNKEGDRVVCHSTGQKIVIDDKEVACFKPVKYFHK